jgi:ABC-type metal ion transport system, periplasmic component/surface antigen
MSFVLRRSVLACLATLGAVLAPAADAQEVTVKVGAVRSISTVAILWAAEKGYFKEYGIKVATETLDTAANSIALLAQNQCSWSRAEFPPATSTPWKRTCRSPWWWTGCRARWGTI